MRSAYSDVLRPHSTLVGSALGTPGFEWTAPAPAMRRTRSPCCARAASGHPAAQSPAMNSRRRIRDPPGRSSASLSRPRMQRNRLLRHGDFVDACRWFCHRTSGGFAAVHEPLRGPQELIPTDRQPCPLTEVHRPSARATGAGGRPRTRRRRAAARAGGGAGGDRKEWG
jgi:hypothetical protein